MTITATSFPKQSTGSEAASAAEQAGQQQGPPLIPQQSRAPRGPITTRRPSRYLGYLPALTVVSDVVAIGLSLATAMIGRESIMLPTQQSPLNTTTPILLLAALLIAAGWLLAIRLGGGYRNEILGAGAEEYKRVVNSSVLTAAVVGISCYLLEFPLSRGFFVLAFALGIVTLVAGRFAFRTLVGRYRRKGALLHRVVIAGSVAHVDEIASVLRRESWLGYYIVGAVTPDVTRRSTTPTGVPLLGQATSVAQVVEAHAADIVFLAGGAFDSAAQVRQLTWELADDKVQIVVAPSVTEIGAERVHVRPVGGLPLIHLDRPRAQNARQWAKRTFDIVGSSALLLAFSPVLIFTALRIRAHDRGPVLFTQTRVGRDGETFGCLKFRTMVTNAEELLAELQAQEGFAGGLFKMENDPRITKPGKWMRRFSVDELPQLINVLRGQMSLIGPRPPLVYEVAQYDEIAHRRLHVRPGMTGLWQVSGRSDLSWSEAIRLDLYYVDNWSMVQDLAILARTFGAVFGSRGAY